MRSIFLKVSWFFHLKNIVVLAEKKEWSVPVQGQNIPATAGSNKKLEKPDNATEVQTVLNTTFTLDTGQYYTFAAFIKIV